ncbi:MAG TPA: DUF2339 domain-containing protein, partial [Blastocatellia bacterium]|nr:DUF2339 domain-containing protein [Blastocatellia bacterium]
MAEDDPALDRLDQLIERVDFMEQTLRSQLARLYTIERHLGIAPAPPVQEQPRPSQPESGAVQARPPVGQRPPVPPPSVQPPISQPPPREQQPDLSKTSGAPPKQLREPLSGPPPDRTVARPREAQTSAHIVRPRPPVPPEPRPRGDLEARIGGNWLNRIGIIAITFGVAFFLKYAFENQWIGPAGRVGIGVVLGLGFLAGGEMLRKRYASYAYGLTGGGILILYLAIYAAFSFYNLIPHPLAFVFMAAVTMIASLLSARYSALPIAVLGLIGGFLTPILLSTGRDNQTGLFTYIALLDAGVLALAYSKQWRILNYMSFGATVLMFVGWMITFYDDSKLWPTIFFLTLLFGIFALLAMTYNVFNRRPTTWADLALVFLNGLLYFGTS